MFGKNVKQLLRSLRPIIRQNTNNATNTIKENEKNTIQQNTNENANSRYGSPHEKVIRDKHLANVTVTSFYCQSAIEQYAAKVQTLLCLFYTEKHVHFFIFFSNQRA